MGKYFYLVVGKSGSGKTTVMAMLQEKFGLKAVPSYTTRPKRFEGETGHTFVTKNEYFALKNRLAETVYHGDCYGTTEQQLEEHDLYVVEPSGVEYFRNVYKGKKPFKVVFIYTSEYTRKHRMKARGDAKERIKQRLDIDKKLFDGMAKKADAVISNEHSIEECAEELYKFIQKCERE